MAILIVKIDDLRFGLFDSERKSPAVESWLRQEVAPPYDALKGGPARVRSVQDVRASLAAEHRRDESALIGAMPFGDRGFTAASVA